MIDLSINLKVEFINNGLLATGQIGDQDVRLYFATSNDLMEQVSKELIGQVKESRHFEGCHDFTLKVEAHCEDGHD